MKKRILSALLCAALLAGTLPAASAAASVSDSVIEQVVGALEIMTGDENGNLNLDNSVTRAEFARMLVAASSYKDKVAAVSNYSPFKDVPYTHWAASYVKTAVEQGWLTGYLDGTYRPLNTITLEEAATGALKLLGYGTSDFVGSYPYGQLALYKSLGLDTRITASQGGTMTRRNMMYLFYNLLTADTADGKVYMETLGYQTDVSGEVDYLALVSDTLDGPFVVETSLSALGISTTGAAVYRNGYASTADAVTKYDVVYVSKGMNTIWAYSNPVTGVYQSASPSTASPTSVTVAGNTYSLGTAEATLALSSMGDLNIGDMVTLLLGKDGTVVAALSASDYAANIYGVVTSVDNVTYQNAVGNAYTARTLTVAATDGATYQVPCSKTSYEEGSLVSIGFGTSGADVSGLKSTSLSGTVSGYTVGKKTIAKSVRILDVNDTSAVRVYASRLEGAVLDSSDVRFYAENAAGEIIDIILKNFTGDLYEYGIITGVQETNDDFSVSGTYTYLLNGEKKTVSTSNKALGASSGPARLTIKNGQLDAVRALTQIKNPTAITLLGIQNADETWYFADDTAVYLSSGTGSYSLLSLTELRNNFSSYSVSAYYDKSTRDGGRIRVVIARAK